MSTKRKTAAQSTLRSVTLRLFLDAMAAILAASRGRFHTCERARIPPLESDLGSRNFAFLFPRKERGGASSFLIGKMARD